MKEFTPYKWTDQAPTQADEGKFFLLECANSEHPIFLGTIQAKKSKGDDSKLVFRSGKHEEEIWFLASNKYVRWMYIPRVFKGKEQI